MENFKKFLILLFVSSISLFSYCTNFRLSSPDGNILLVVSAEDILTWSAYLEDQPVMENCPVSISMSSGQVLGKELKVLKNEIRTFKEQIFPLVPRKKSVIDDAYNELSLTMKGDYKIVFRAYNSGFAYRFETNFKDEIEVENEQLEINFSDNMTAWFPEEESFISHYERDYIKEQVNDIGSSRFCSLPVLFESAKGTKVLFTEADLFDYPCMFLFGSGENYMKAGFPKRVLEVTVPERGGDRNEIISKKADHIAKTAGERTFPWRLFYVTGNDADLLTNDLVYQLSRPSQLENSDWITPGKVAWDWWNANNIYGVDFKSGINTETYKYYIDFASKYNLEYIILDEGWSETTTNVKETNPDIDMEELVRYANGKNVGIILWLLWKPLDKEMNSILDQYQRWGIKGIKVDFMQRADQYMVNYYERVAREAAKRKMLVDFHGAFKPSGLRRAYPNVISYEGLKGLENSKWSDAITPEHDVTIPFIRMVAGPMDFTPGAMKNAQPDNFFPRFERPMSQGTRCHQIAMYVIYESPLQMLSDSPSNYYKESECTEYIVRIPTIWDDTEVLAAKVGEFIALARRNGDNWYIGAMNNGEQRELELDLSFLPEGRYTAEIMQDGINADRYAEDYKKVVTSFDNNTKLNINLFPGGGWAAIIKL